LENHTFQKSVAFTLGDAVQYIPRSIVIQTIVKKLTGNVSLISVESGEIIGDKILPFDTLIQIIDGNADIIIDGQLSSLSTGQAIIIPAHTSNSMEASVRFKMVSTIIRSGYEEVGIVDIL
jgi:quercetin dioxygenase-like cupin family protein